MVLKYPTRFGGALFKGIFQVVNSTDLRDIKYIFKLNDVIMEFSSTRLLQTSWFQTEKVKHVRCLNLHNKLFVKVCVCQSWKELVDILQETVTTQDYNRIKKMALRWR